MNSSERVIRVQALSRVEGEGGLHVRLNHGRVTHVELRIYEPPRFFEAMLQGRDFSEIADIVARICGICPVAYQLTAVQAIERAMGIELTPELRRLRRLLYCGEWIESHALHMHLLHAPDFFGCESGAQLAERWPAEVQRGLRLRKHGNQLLEVLGGRAIHPINVAVGGFHRLPKRSEMDALIPDLEWGLEAALAATRWVAGFNFPDFEQDYDFVALKHPDEYPLNAGTIRSSQGAEWPVDAFESEFLENQVAHSTAMQATRRSTGAPYFVGPLARVNLNQACLATPARELAGELPIRWPCRNPFVGIVARGLELIHAYREALDIVRMYQPGPPRVDFEACAGEGCAATEAPRGVLYQRLQFDGQGFVTFAKIVPPTSQNQSRIEHDLRAWLPALLDQPDNEISHACERLIRSYDPCISCSTHFLRLKLER